MPRAIWSGAISFGLITVPVRLYSAVSRKSVRFNQLDQRTGSRIKRKWVSALDGEEVPNDELVRGYEITSGNYVTVSDEELRSLDPEASRSIDIVEFVDLADVDPLAYDNAYYLEPDDLAVKAYKVLLVALEQAGKVAVARIVMRQKEYLAVIRPTDNALVLSTMVYADEINPVEGIEGLDKVADIAVTEAEITMAEQLIGALEADYEPEKYADGYRERVLELIQKKSEGEEIMVAEEAPVAASSHVVDLMAAQAWPKTSGSKGLQLYVPLNTPHTHHHVSAFAKATGQLLERDRPRQVTTTMGARNRIGKVLIDWSQNSRHKTTIAPYSLRAKPNPTVSTPITWDEVDAGADGAPLSFEADIVLKRVSELGDLFAPTVALEQTLPGAA